MMMKQSALIVFDMDGVLIDVSTSYREAVRQTARYFFTGAQGWQDLPDPLFSLSELAAVKQTGGLNNDWDLTCRVIQLLSRRIRTHSLPGDGRGDPWEYYQKTVSGWDVTPLADFLHSVDKPLSQLLTEKAEPQEAFVRAMHKGDVGQGNIIKQIFQELYLGHPLFLNMYGLSPVIHKYNGLNLSEKLIIKKKYIEELHGRNRLAIATGRPHAEALYPLKAFSLDSFFSHLLTLDDCLAAEKKSDMGTGINHSLSKPDPFMLDAITAEIRPLPARRYYVGDMPDDMIAASRAKDPFIGIGFTATAPDKPGLKAKLVAAGARQVFTDVAGLIAFFSSPD